ncbi:MAG: GNAT family N-acetyltransferase [Verrucomicrobiota bacterium]
MFVRPLSFDEHTAFEIRCRAAGMCSSTLCLPEPPGHVFVFEEEEMIKGWIITVPALDRENRGLLCSVWVEPPFRGKGVACELIQSALVWAMENQMDAIELWVRETNRSARRLYLQFGFRETGRMRTPEGSEKDQAVHMIYPIPEPIAA